MRTCRWWTATRTAARTATWRAIYASVGDFNARIEENVGGIRRPFLPLPPEEERELLLKIDEIGLKEIEGRG